MSVEEHLLTHLEGTRAEHEWNSFILEGQFPPKWTFIHFPHSLSEPRRRCFSAPPRVCLERRQAAKPLRRGDAKWRRRVAGKLQRFCCNSTQLDCWIAEDCSEAIAPSIQSRDTKFAEICSKLRTFTAF